MAAPMDHHAVQVASLNLCSKDNYSNYSYVISGVFHDYQSFHSQKSSSLDDIVSNINSSLNTSKDRLHGLSLLQHYITQCSTDSFSANVISWLRQILQILQSYNSVTCYQVTCRVLSIILSHLPAFPELSRDVSTTLIPQFLTSLLNANPEWQSASLTGIKGCLQHFSGSCGSFKGKIEMHLVEILDGPNPESWQSVAECLCLLPSCGGSGHQGIKYTEAWSTLVKQITGSLSNTLNQLYDGFEDGDVKVEHEGLRGLSDFTDNEPIRTLALTNRYLALTMCLRYILSRETSFLVKVQIQDIIDFVCRTLAVTAERLVLRPSTERLLVSSIIGQVHNEALKLLKELIICCRGNLIQHVSTINQLLGQSLRWTALGSDSYGSQRPLSGLRETTYSVIVTLLTVLGASAMMDSHVDGIVNAILGDAKIQEQVIKLDGSKTIDTYSQPSKKKRKGKRVNSKETTEVYKINCQANWELCCSGLKALRQILITIGNKLKLKTLKLIQSYVVQQILEIQRNREQTPLPYINTECRKELYHVLQATVLVAHPSVPNIMPCAMRLFSIGQQDPCPEIVQFNMEASTICVSLIHPTIPRIRRDIITDDINQENKTTPSSQTFELPLVHMETADVRLPDHEPVVTTEITEKSEDINEEDVIVEEKKGDVESENESEEVSQTEKHTESSDEEPEQEDNQVDKNIINNDDVNGNDELKVPTELSNERQPFNPQKRKIELSEEEISNEIPCKKIEVEATNEETDFMLASFVDSTPDSD